jgi:Beta/Gamma crystallin
MSNINQTQDLFALDTVQDLDNETAAKCSGGVGYLYGRDPDVILYEHEKGGGKSMSVNAATGDGIPNIGFINGQGAGSHPTGFNDITSSIWIKRGVWIFHDDAGYNGQTTGVLRAGFRYDLGANNDRITSLFRVAP